LTPVFDPGIRIRAAYAMTRVNKNNRLAKWHLASWKKKGSVMNGLVDQDRGHEAAAKGSGALWNGLLSFRECRHGITRRFRTRALILICFFLPLFVFHGAKAEDVMIFHIEKYDSYQDVLTYGDLARELKLSSRVVDYRFLNDKTSFFDAEGRRKFKVLVLPGGEPYRWFEKKEGKGISCQGVDNILKFIESGGSVIAVCICGSSIFASSEEWLNPSLEEAQQGLWTRTNRWPGAFKAFCGVEAFKGKLRGPQETNRPYPTPRFLPIRMNPENEIVRSAGLPPEIYQVVVGGGSILPDPGQPLDVVGWFPNGTAAIGIVPYGKGHIIMSNPHPNITGETARKWIANSAKHMRRWGWSEKMIKEAMQQFETEGDPDGPGPDWALAKGMLSYACKKASE
jgi:glutamine amidotransferase-like uncharacterized protein